MTTTAFPKRKIWTYDDYLTLPDDLNIYEVIEGDLHMTPAPVPRHQEVCHNLQRLLGDHVRKYNLGKIYPAPIDVILDKSNVLQPDIIFISKDNLSIITEKNILGPPDLVIEILSPTTIKKDRVSKVKTYARFGVKHLWLVDPDNQTLEIFNLDRKKNYRLMACLAGEEEFRPSLFPNLTMPLKEIWG